MDNKLRDTIYYLVLKFSDLPQNYNSKKKLAKLLYLIDFYYFKEHDIVIATDRYKAFPMGPLPEDFYKVLGEMESEGSVVLKRIKFRNQGGKQYDYEIYEPGKTISISLNAAEKKHIDKIFEKFKNSTALKLEQLSHSQAPWNSVDEKESIPILTAHLLPDFDDLQA